MKYRLLAAAALAVPLLASAQVAKDKPAAKGATGPIATVNGVGISRARGEFLLNQQMARGAPDNDQTRAMVREELVNREVIAQEATRSGLAKTQEVQMQVDLARQEIVVSAYLREWARKNPPADADVQKEYERVKALQGDRQYRARHILVESEDKAKGLIAELKKGGKFDELAKKNSSDTGSADRGGDLDWNVPTAYDKAFSDAMTKLEKGKFSETPVRTRFGFHIIQLDDVRAVKFPELAEVKPRIQQQLMQGKVEQLIQALRAKAKVE
ncbi:MAG TPA: peptidylprolyl isomerase [Burkholderiales bacterium]